MDANIIAENIVELVRTAHEQRVNGINLVPALRLRFPEFAPQQFNCLSLKDFITRFVPQLQAVAQHGPDVTYALASSTSGPPQNLKEESAHTHAPDAATDQPDTDSQAHAGGSGESKYASTIKNARTAGRLPLKVWFAFSNIASPELPIVNTVTGDLSTVLRGQALPGEDWKVIDPLTREDHVQMARAFLDRVPESHRPTVEALVGGTGTWWKDHYKVLTSLGLAPDWKHFHNAAVQNMFFDRVRAAGVHLSGGAKPAAPSFLRQMPSSPGGGYHRTARLRAMALRLVAAMSGRELAQLPLTLGEAIELFEER